METPRYSVTLILCAENGCEKVVILEREIALPCRPQFGDELAVDGCILCVSKVVLAVDTTNIKAYVSVKDIVDIQGLLDAGWKVHYDN